MKNIAIMRTACERPAMLKLSLEYQAKADLSDEFTTYLYLDRPKKNADSIINKNKEVLSGFNNKKEIVTRPCNFNINKNYLEACRDLFGAGFQYVLAMEEDTIISKDFFRLCEKVIDSGYLSGSISTFLAGWPSDGLG